MSTLTFFFFPYANYFSLDLPCTLSFKKIGHSLGNNHMWSQPNKFCGMNLWRPYWYKNLVVDFIFSFIHFLNFLLLSTKKRWLKAWFFHLVKCQMFVFLTYLFLGFPSGNTPWDLIVFILRNGFPCHLPLLVWLRIVGPRVLISSANQIRHVYFLTLQNFEYIYIY